MPADTKPHIARLARRQRKVEKYGDLGALRKKLWQAITAGEDVLLDSETDAATRLKAVHAISQSVVSYLKVIEVGEHEARLTELERRNEPNVIMMRGVSSI